MGPNLRIKIDFHLNNRPYLSCTRGSSCILKSFGGREQALAEGDHPSRTNEISSIRLRGLQVQLWSLCTINSAVICRRILFNWPTDSDATKPDKPENNSSLRPLRPASAGVS